MHDEAGSSSDPKHPARVAHLEHFAPPSAPVPPARRYHAFDAIRGAAMTLGVLLHGTIAYLVLPLPRLLWPVHDAQRSFIVDAIFWWIHGFRIPLFFIVAGFFAVMLVRRRGPDAYLKHRTKRILLPLLAAIAIVLPLVLLLWMHGFVRGGRASWDELWHWSFHDREIRKNIEGLAHLWFLEYLYIYCLAFWAWRRWRARGDGEAARSAKLRIRAQRLFTSPFRVLVLALPTALLLAHDPELFLEFRNDLLPPMLDLAYYGYFFLIGAWLYPMRDRLDVIVRGSGINLLLTIPAAALMLILLWAALSIPPHVDLPWRLRIALAMSVAIFCWLSVFGWLGFFLRWLDVDRPLVRSLSDASYWVYLVHLPLVGGLHLLIASAPMHAALKCALVTSVAYAACLLTYHLLVRPTVIGRFLTGPRGRYSSTSPTSPTSPPRRAAFVSEDRAA